MDQVTIISSHRLIRASLNAILLNYKVGFSRMNNLSVLRVYYKQDLTNLVYESIITKVCFGFVKSETQYC